MPMQPNTQSETDKDENKGRTKKHEEEHAKHMEETQT